MRIDRGPIQPPPPQPEPRETTTTSLNVYQKIGYTLVLLSLFMFVAGVLAAIWTGSRVLLEIVTTIWAGIVVVFLFASFIRIIIIIWKS